MSTQTPSRAGSARPATSDHDLFSPEHLADPFPALDELRDLAPAVYMSRHDFWLLSRYDEVRAASADWQTFSSALGVALLDESNRALAGTFLASDPPEHDEFRAVLAEQTAPRGMRRLRDDVAATADRLVAAVVGRGRVDGVEDLARVLPVNVVADLVGLPQQGRERIQPGAADMQYLFGPNTPQFREVAPTVGEYLGWVASLAHRDQIAPGSWGAAVLDAVDEGRLTVDQGISTLTAVLTAGIDTTVNAIGSLLRLFAERPAVWRTLREEPTLASAAFEEALRLESPVQGFFRGTTKETTIGSATLPPGSRVMLHWGAANRDPRHYQDPHLFDLRRNALDHLAFGHGVHGCAGQAVARLEASCLLDSLIAKVTTFSLAGEPAYATSPVARSLSSLPLLIEPVEA